MSAYLVAFCLPPTFPADLVPDKAAQFVRDAKQGTTQGELMELARDRGLDPTWKPLPHIGADVYGLGLVVDGMVVPFMVKMADALDPATTLKRMAEGVDADR